MVENKFSLSAAAAGFLSLTLWVFGPAYIYFTNTLEFNFSFSQALPWLLAATGVSMLLLMGLLYLLKKEFFQTGISLVFASAVLLWIQGNILVWHYGPLDGREIHWLAKWPLGLLDGGLWAVVIILALVKPGFFYKISRRGSLVFITIQLISVIIAAVQAPKIPSFKHYRIDESTKFSFSTRKNAIILMLDTFQSDLFQEIINENEDYKNIFRGFTYFRNTLSSAPKTYVSVPSFLTGHVYDNSLPMQEFIEKAYQSDSSLPGVLMKDGYRVELYPYPHTEKTIYFSKSTASNIKERGAGGLAGEQLGLLVDISWFRQVPHFVKPFVYNNQAWLLKRLFAPPTPQAMVKKAGTSGKERRFSKEASKLSDIRFIRQMLAEATADQELPVFKYFHLNGLHRPLVLDENLEFHPMPYNRRSSFKHQGKACLEITRLFLEKLKAIGQYDNSLIVVLGDHGCADYPYGVNVRAAGLAEPPGSGIKIPPHIKAAGLPLLLIKPIHAGDEELKITDAPVSLKDLPATAAAALGLTPSIPGPSMFDAREQDARERRFYYYNWNGWGDGYLYHMREYAVRGHAWLDSSWRELGMKRPATARIPYEYGTPVRFSRNGNAQRYQGIGWHGPEKYGFTWTREKKAGLFFTIEPPTADLILKIVLKPYLVPGKLDVQEVGISVNDHQLEKLVIRNPAEAEYRVVIPRRLVPGPELRILFDIPTATAPVDLNLGNDVRTLGIAVRRLVIEPKSRD